MTDIGFPFDDTQDFDDTERGFIAKATTRQITAADGRVVWDLDAYRFLDEPAGDTAHPSLWRQGQLLIRDGLFEVVPGIYQLRGFDLSVMSVIEGDTGVIVIDPLISKETAAAAWALYQEHRATARVVAMIYTHSHIDHFGGVKGVDRRSRRRRRADLDHRSRRLHGGGRRRERLRRHGDGSPLGLHVRRRTPQGAGRPDRLRTRPDHLDGRADVDPADDRHRDHRPGVDHRRRADRVPGDARTPKLPPR